MGVASEGGTHCFLGGVSSTKPTGHPFPPTMPRTNSALKQSQSKAECTLHVGFSEKAPVVERTGREQTSEKDKNKEMEKTSRNHPTTALTRKTKADSQGSKPVRVG